MLHTPCHCVKLDVGPLLLGYFWAIHPWKTCKYLFIYPGTGRYETNRLDIMLCQASDELSRAAHYIAIFIFAHNKCSGGCMNTACGHRGQPPSGSNHTEANFYHYKIKQQPVNAIFMTIVLQNLDDMF